MATYTITTGTVCDKPVRTSLMAHLADILGIARQRRQLAKLDDAALKDIGLTRKEAETEIKRPVWDAPEQWKR